MILTKLLISLLLFGGDIRKRRGERRRMMPLEILLASLNAEIRILHDWYSAWHVLYVDPWWMAWRVVDRDGRINPPCYEIREHSLEKLLGEIYEERE